MKPVVWNLATAKKELNKRLSDAKRFRMRYESQWEANEQILFNTSGAEGGQSDARYSFESDLELGIGDVDSANQTVGVNYLFKNYRFIHAQMSANPPSVVARPTSTDPTDKSKADAADRLIRHAIRAENMQEKVDIASGKGLLYGTGWMKTWFNPHDGDIVGRDPKTGEIELEGVIDIYSPSTWNVWLDPHARVWHKVRYVFEKHSIPYDEAEFQWPEFKETLKKATRKNVLQSGVQYSDDTELQQETLDIYEYYEKGLPINGMIGRYCMCLEDGTVLGEIKHNPFNFSPPADNKDDEMPPTAYLPYHILTDIDIPDEVFGKSFVEYEAPIQEIINRLDSTSLENSIVHGIPRLILPESAEISEDSITNCTMDIIKITGTQGPYFQDMPGTMPEMSQLRDRLKAGGDDMAGVNEAMFGQQSREQSGFSMQYATNQGNMIRRRLFNKYVLFVESIYKAYLNLVRKHWDEPRIINVLGQERAFESIDIKGADINGGFDIVVEYGASLSLDPTTRREELMQLMPLFEKAGVDSKSILSMMKLNELEGLYDIMQLAEQRQHEIFEEMLIKETYIEPRQLQEHKGMLTYSYRYVMTAEFGNLEESQKALIEEHIRAREGLAAQGASVDTMGPQAPGPKGGEPVVAGLPATGGMAAGAAPTEVPPVEAIPGM